MCFPGLQVAGNNYFVKEHFFQEYHGTRPLINTVGKCSFTEILRLKLYNYNLLALVRTCYFPLLISVGSICRTKGPIAGSQFQTVLCLFHVSALALLEDYFLERQEKADTAR